MSHCLLYLSRFVKKSVGFGHMNIDTHWVLLLEVWCTLFGYAHFVCLKMGK